MDKLILEIEIHILLQLNSLGKAADPAKFPLYFGLNTGPDVCGRDFWLKGHEFESLRKI